MNVLLKLIGVIMVGALAASLSSAQVTTEKPLMLIRMPDEASSLHQPSDAAISRFVASRGPILNMTRQDLMRDRDLARQVLGQHQIFDELSTFGAQHGMTIKVKFITWADAFRYFADYVSDASNPPVVAQLGDTWAAYFRSLGVMPYEQRHTWDVRVLWYWKDLVNAEDVADGDGFVKLCRRLHSTPPAGLVAPFAIPTALDWNLLHDLSIWLYNAGLPSLISTDKKLGLLPWKQAVFAGPEGEQAARFLIRLAEHGYVALPDELSDELAEDFLARKYAMVILGPWVAELAEKRLGSEWELSLGAALPPRIGAAAATTVKGGSLLVVLDPGRGRDPIGVARARRLVDFFASSQSQRRYTRALGALPANPSVLVESPHFNLFKTALERGKTYPQLPQWAPVVENLATRDSLYAFWKRLSALTDTHSVVSKVQQAARERLILAALYSAQADINKELSPGKFSFLWPWLMAVILLLVAVTAVSVWHRRVERQRIEELRQARDNLATLQRRMVALKQAGGETAPPALADTPALATKGYPALYLDTVKRQVLVRKSPAHPLEEVIHGAEYDLFRHIIECLQVGWFETHWIWGGIIWPTSHPQFPKEAFATHCTKLRNKIEKVWQLGRMLGRGAHHGGAIPIEVRDVHFYTDAKAEASAYPVWLLFHASEQCLKAWKAEEWDQAHRHVEQLLQIDHDNWPGNMLLCQLVIGSHAGMHDPLSQQAMEFAHKQRAQYEQTLEKMEKLAVEKVNQDQRERIRSRLESLLQVTSQLPSPRPGDQPPGERKPWRTRNQLRGWANYLNGERRALPGRELRILQDVKRFVVGRLHWAPPKEAEDYFRDFVQDLALDESVWPDERLPGSEKAFKYRVLDYVLAGIYHLSDDDESRASTKAQNLRKLWSARAYLRERLEREPTHDELCQECQRRYRWGHQVVDHLLELERFCRPRSFDESRK